ncbi:LysM domain-containing protein [Clostridium sp. USBA 49]|uniref:LysM peptidoglycan-binding domain-containing protein n=1 Tax=Clostridium sp. USBA 49 TaxID=1881060 RepID=UPI000998ED29|nr:LysM domain-containing protein [Clostridium sp. USBA 49]SKA89533.1 LysM domain-containing protein [Clostridium sp. USBA 49]
MRINKKIFLISLMVTILIIIISSIQRNYDNKSFKMLYKVQAGEKLTDIARKFDVDVETIEDINNCGEYIAEGTILEIPID